MPTRDLTDCETDLREKVQRLLQICNGGGELRGSRVLRALNLEARVICVLRSDEEQKALWAIGRTEKLSWRKVTSLDGVVNRSKHQANSNGLSEAVDIALFDKDTGEVNWKSFLGYYIMGKQGERLGLVWGGRWTMKDYCHLQI